MKETDGNKSEIWSGLEHILHLNQSKAQAKKSLLQNSSKRVLGHLRNIGNCLCVLYQAGTCHRRCLGGPHLFESLCGRAYNLASATIELVLTAHYDEAFCLIRSIGEISNLLSLSIANHQAFNVWIKATPKDRVRRYGPGWVRKEIVKTPDGKHLIYATDDWYSMLSEKFTHATPHTKPNFHSEDVPFSGFVGGVFQTEGMERSLQELETILLFASMIVCRHFGFDDLMKNFFSDEALSENAREDNVQGDRS